MTRDSRCLSHRGNVERPGGEVDRPAGDIEHPRARFEHRPVMLHEVVELLAPCPPGVIIDATVGAGGHAAALLSESPRHRLIGLDRDPEALEAAESTLRPFGARSALLHARFDRLGEIAADLAPGLPVSGVLFDLGVSSWQLDDPGRGFSYRFDAPLDMRMDRGDRLTATDVVNTWEARELARIFAANGENRFALLIARAIVRNRPITSTGKLSEVVRAAIPASARRRGGHPAKRVFQALRVIVNEELELLRPALDAAIDLLVPTGRVVVISYHSGEDRLVKEHFAAAASGWCTCPPGLPCACGAVPLVRLLNRGARMATTGEREANRRAQSARLRAAERLDAKPRRTGAPRGEET